MPIFQKVEKEQKDVIIELSRLAGAIVKEYYDPIIGEEQNDYMIAMFQSPEAIQGDLEKGHTYYIICEQDGTRVGYFACYPKEGKWYLNKYYLQREARGKGYGRQAMNLICKLAKEAGMSSVFLNVNKYNRDSIALYEHMGFYLLREEKNPIGGGYYMDDYVFILDI